MGHGRRRRAFSFEDVQRIEVAGLPAIAVTGTQRVAAETFAKALVVVAADDTMVQLTGTIEPGDPLSAAELISVLRAARWNAQPAPGDLGVDLTPASGYQRQPGGTAALLLTLGGETGAGVPKFLASRSMGRVQVDVVSSGRTPRRGSASCRPRRRSNRRRR